VLFAIAIRAPYTHLVEGVFGGDAFNYLSKSRALLAGQDFFAADSRKGPVFSLLIAPGLFMLDPLWWSRWVGIIAAAGTVTLTVFIARRLQLGWPAAAIAGLLVAVNMEFLWESSNGLANTTYVCVYRGFDISVFTVPGYKSKEISSSPKRIVRAYVFNSLRRHHDRRYFAASGLGANQTAVQAHRAFSSSGWYGDGHSAFFLCVVRSFGYSHNR
jgi:hypothetical protein